VGEGWRTGGGTGTENRRFFIKLKNRPILDVVRGVGLAGWKVVKNVPSLFVWVGFCGKGRAGGGGGRGDLGRCHVGGGGMVVGVF
jgi:hypothetical protein